MYWLVMIRMARVVKCPFCDVEFRVREDVSDLEAAAWLESSHIPAHAETLVRAAYEPVAPRRCSRCHRYDDQGLAPGDRLHRPCYHVACDCGCSYPAKENA